MTIAQDLKALNRNIQTLGKTLDRLLKAVEKDANLKAKPTKKAPAKKAPAKKAPVKKETCSDGSCSNPKTKNQWYIGIAVIVLVTIFSIGLPI